VFESNPNQAFTTLVTQVLQARKRLINAGKRGWSLAILVPTKRMTRFVSNILREPFGEIAAVAHTAAVDMEGPILAAEIVAFLLQQGSDPDHFDQFVIRYEIIGASLSDCFRKGTGDMVSPSGTRGAGSTKVRAGRR
jgi:DNA helicase-2/ATP-dependent DNA helicase PcrA